MFINNNKCFNSVFSDVQIMIIKRKGILKLSCFYPILSPGPGPPTKFPMHWWRPSPTWITALVEGLSNSMFRCFTVLCFTVAAITHQNAAFCIGWSRARNKEGCCLLQFFSYRNRDRWNGASSRTVFRYQHPCFGKTLIFFFLYFGFSFLFYFLGIRSWFLWIL